MGLLEGEKREKATEILFEEIMAKNFPKWMESINLHIQENQKTLSSLNLKMSICRHVIIILLKDKESI